MSLHPQLVSWCHHCFHQILNSKFLNISLLIFIVGRNIFKLWAFGKIKKKFTTLNHIFECKTNKYYIYCLLMILTNKHYNWYIYIYIFYKVDTSCVGGVYVFLELIITLLYTRPVDAFKIHHPPRACLLYALLHFMRHWVKRIQSVFIFVLV